jgi:protein-tyrosine phosphatase
LQAVLDEEQIPLQLSFGADTHLVPDLVPGLRDGRIPSLADTRYFLLEPPHHVAPPHFEEFVFNTVAAGYIPVITHPERLSWVEDHYEVFGRLVYGGALMQITAGSLTGRFGSRVRYWAERFVDDGIVHILATDAHSVDRRPPLLAEGRDAVERRLGGEEAEHLVETRPRGILENVEPRDLPPVPRAQAAGGVRRVRSRGLLSRLFERYK